MAANQEAKVKLYWLDESRAQSTHWLLEELNVEYELEIYHRTKQQLAPPEALKLHPLGKFPLVEVSGASGAPIQLAESGFITQYLCEHFGQGKNLVPRKWKDGQEGKIGGETDEWLRYEYMLHYIEGSLMAFFTNVIYIGALKSPLIPFFIRPVTSAIASQFFSGYLFPNAKLHFGMLEDMLKTSPAGGKYLCGDHLTAVDILLLFPLQASAKYMKDIGSWPNGSIQAAYPSVYAYVDRLEKEPGYIRADKRRREEDPESKI